jgi:predicted RNase H-like HicB family nuclease
MGEYFVISSDEDGTTVQQYTKEELLKNIDEGYWGEIDFLREVNECDTSIRYRL